MTTRATVEQFPEILGYLEGIWYRCDGTCSGDCWVDAGLEVIALRAGYTARAWRQLAPDSVDDAVSEELTFLLEVMNRRARVEYLAAPLFPAPAPREARV
jgi:hypothetical protein